MTSKYVYAANAAKKRKYPCEEEEAEETEVP